MQMVVEYKANVSYSDCEYYVMVVVDVRHQVGIVLLWMGVWTVVSSTAVVLRLQLQYAIEAA